MKRFFFLMFGAFLFVAVSAQEKENTPFNGVVEDVFGQPLKGVKVWVVSPKYYAVSNK